jgi:hypothetical protein
MVDRAEQTKLFKAFLADETAAWAEDRQGEFWPSNHHRLDPALPDLPLCLEPADRERCYCHLLRVSGGIPAVAETEFPLLVAGYRQLLPDIDRGFPNRASRLKTLFAFGFDGEGALSGGATAGAKELKLRNKVLAQTAKYTSLPSQREKLEKFRPLAGEAERILQVLRHLGYRQGRRNADGEGYTDLTFWGLILVALLDPAVRLALVRDMLEGGFDIPRRDVHLAVLNKTVQAVVPECGPDETAFRALAARLSAIEQQRRDATESVALARRLALPFTDDEDWLVRITLPEAQSTKHPLLGPNLSLEICPDPEFEWTLQLRTEARGRFAEWTGRVSRNDFGLDGLGRGNLAEFPRWLRTACEKSGLTYDIERVVIDCGRKKAAVKMIAAWLAAPGA